MDIQYLIYEPDPLGYVFGAWIGPNTIGSSSFRGTRVWFRSPNVESYDYEFTNLDERNEFIRNLQNSNGDLEDYCNLRHKNLEDIISAMERNSSNTICDFYGGAIEDFATQVTNNAWYYEPELTEDTPRLYYLPQENKGPILMHDIVSTTKFWIFPNSNILYETIQELKEVLKYFKSQNVTFVWR